MNQPPVVDLAALARQVREEALITDAWVELARRAFRGRPVPREVRRLMSQAGRSARSAREHARHLDDLLAVREAGAAVSA